MVSGDTESKAAGSFQPCRSDRVPGTVGEDSTDPPKCFGGDYVAFRLDDRSEDPFLRQVYSSQVGWSGIYLM